MPCSKQFNQFFSQQLYTTVQECTEMEWTYFQGPVFVELFDV